MTNTDNNKNKAQLPLAGIKVADFSRLLPGPWCAQLLSDFGAEVVKIEQPGVGDHSRHNPPNFREASVYFNSVNGGKRGLALDLATTDGLKVAERLFGWADVVLESFRPGVTQKLKIDYDNAKAHNPSLVYCSISGYGQDGPLSRVPGHDLVIQSMTGLMGMNLDREPVPPVPGFQSADYAAAAMATIGVLAALVRRKETGEGCYIDLSMFDSLFSMGNIVLLGGMARLAGQSGQPMLEAFGANPRYNTYRCKDGKPVAVSLLEARNWAQFCTVIGREDLIFEDEGPEHRHTDHGGRADLFRSAIQEYCQSMDRQDLLRAMEAHQIPISAINTPDEALAEPVVAARGLVDYTEHPKEGRVPRLVSPFARAGLTRTDRTGAPELGEDTEDVLAELGYSPEEREALKKAGVATS